MVNIIKGTEHPEEFQGRAMDKEANFERVDRALWILLARYVKDEPWKSETVFVLANQIKKLFKALGYHKLPKMEAREIKHWSDCAVYNEPAYPKEECDCGFQLQKNIGNIIEEYSCNPEDYSLINVAREIISLVLPKDKPPLLSDEEIDGLFKVFKLEELADLRIKRHWWAFPFVYTWELVRDLILLNMRTPRVIAQAQWDIWNKAIYGEK